MFIDFLILGLACWRLSNMVVGEEGPWYIFRSIRTAVGVGIGDSSDPDYPWYKKVFECVWCASVWISIFWSILYLVYPQAAIWSSMPFAISAIAILLHTVMEHMQQP